MSVKQTIPWSSFTPKLPSVTPVQFAPRLFRCDDHEGDIPSGAGMILETTPICPAANDVFDQHELEARIAAYAKRAAAKRPLFTKSRRRVKDDRRWGYKICDACGLTAPNHTKPEAGWASRRVCFSGVGLNETYCPTCFDLHGWVELYIESQTGEKNGR